MVLFSDGFESHDFTAWTSQSGTIAVDELGFAHHGTHYAHVEPPAWGNGYTFKTLAANQLTLYTRAYFYFVTLPNSDDKAVLFTILSDGATVGAYAELTFDGADVHLWIDYLNGAGRSQTAKSATVIATGKWYCIELYNFSDNVNGAGKLYIDGVEECAFAGIDNDGGLLGNRYAAFGAKGKAAACSWYMDCCVADVAYIGVEAAAGPTVKKGSNLANTMTTMLNSKMLFSACNRFPKLNPRMF